MAITTIQRDGQAVKPFDALALDPEQLASPAAQRARVAGLLEVKHRAAASSARLAWLARPLLLAVVSVSALHIFGQVARFAPPTIEALALPALAYHGTAAALTLAVDLVALWLVAAGGALRLAGSPAPRLALAYTLVLTFLLNAAYMLSYAPALDAQARAAVLPWLDGLFVVLLPAFIPVALYAVEGAAQRLEAARLVLTVEAAALGGLVEEAQPAPSLPTIGGLAPALSLARELPTYPAPELVEPPMGAPMAAEAASLPGSNDGNAPIAIYACRHCGADGLTKAEQLAHGRQHAAERRKAQAQEVNQ